jgi:LysW-gamma-L-lysine carboxypeptidase
MRVLTQEQAASAYLVDAMRAHGYDEACVDAAATRWASGAGRARDRFARTHDTVPGHIPVRQEGDLLYGRGSVDAKGRWRVSCQPCRLPKRDTCRLVVVALLRKKPRLRRARHVIGKYHPECFIIGEPSQWQA